jgi:ornithine carbamoyltransferase
MEKVKHLLHIKDLTKDDILDLIKKAQKIKANPKGYQKSLYEKELLLIFEVPSLRTRISFQTGIAQMGGSSINYYTIHSPWGHGKETVEDTARVISRYVDFVMIRMNSHKEFLKFAKNSSVPVINGLTSYEHPCQILSDFLTIKEKKDNIKKLAYFGDSNNNVTHSLIFACSLLGIDISIACPKDKDFSPLKSVIKTAEKFAKKSKIHITQNPKVAAKNADVIYTDSWMSYRIPKEEKDKREKILKPFRVTSSLMNLAKKDAIFMHCLPANRNHEVEAKVIDGPQSVILDQAENRLHMQKAIMLWLMNTH